MMQNTTEQAKISAMHLTNLHLTAIVWLQLPSIMGIGAIA